MKKIMIPVVIVIALILLCIGIGTYHAITAETSEHKTNKWLTVISSMISPTVGIISVGVAVYAVRHSDKVSAKADDLSTKAISASVRPYIRVSLEESRRPNNDWEYHEIFAENIGNGSAHDLVFKMKNPNTGYEEEERLDSLAVGEKLRITCPIFTPEDRKAQAERYGRFKGLKPLNVEITCKDILDEEHPYKQIIS